MQYTIPLMMNASGAPQGLFCAHTTEGPIVIVFSHTPRWTRFASAVSRVLAKEKLKLGAATIDADSLEDVLAWVAKVDPATAKEAKLLPDTAPLYSDVLAYFEEQAG